MSRSEVIGFLILTVQLNRIFGINGFKVPVNMNDDGNGNRCFGSSNGNDEKRKKHSVQLVIPKVFVKSNKVDVYAVQHQFHSHEHGNHIPAREKTVNANEKQRCTEDEDFGKGDVHGMLFMGFTEVFMLI
jgi:hypothetical protein